MFETAVLGCKVIWRLNHHLLYSVKMGEKNLEVPEESSYRDGKDKQERNMGWAKVKGAVTGGEGRDSQDKNS